MADTVEFLEAWTLERSDRRALTRKDAGMIAEQWTADAADNGIAAEDLANAAGGDLAAYLLRTYGEEGQEMTTDDADHSDGATIQPPVPDDDRVGLF